MSESPGSVTENAALQGLEANSIVNVQGWLVDAMINDDLRVLLGGDPKTVKSVFEKLMAIGNAHVRDSLEVQRRMHHPAEGQLRDLRFEVQRLRENNARGGALVDELRTEIDRGQTRERSLERANDQWQAELTSSQAKIELLTKTMKKARESRSRERKTHPQQQEGLLLQTTGIRMTDLDDASDVSQDEAQMKQNGLPESKFRPADLGAIGGSREASSRSKGKYAFYAVRKGRQPGIYTEWGDCFQQTNGCHNEYQGFKSLEDAKVFMGGERAKQIADTRGGAESLGGGMSHQASHQASMRAGDRVDMNSSTLSLDFANASQVAKERFDCRVATLTTNTFRPGPPTDTGKHAGLCHNKQGGPYGNNSNDTEG
jgi:hypothetical protein